MVKKTLINVIKALSLILIVLLLIYLFKSSRSLGYHIFEDKAKSVKGSPDVVQAVIIITEKESLLNIGKDLERKGIIKDKYAFAVSVRFMEGYDSIIAGSYAVESSMKPSEILKVITTPSEETNE